MFHRPHILANPIAGGGRAASQAHLLRTACDAHGMVSTLRLTEDAGDAEAFARDLPEATDALIVVGGDGTLNSALNGLEDITLPFTQLPMGTANVLACEYNLPKTVELCAQMLVQGRCQAVPIGRANGQRFVLFVGIGMDAAIVYRLEQVRTGTLGKLKWTGPVLHTIWNWPDPVLRLTLPDGSTRKNLSQILVTLVANYGGIMRMPHQHGDEFSVLCFRQRRRISYAYATARALFGRLRPGIDVEVIGTRSLSIESASPAHVQLDGDHGGSTPVTIEFETGDAQLIVP